MQVEVLLSFVTLSEITYLTGTTVKGALLRAYLNHLAH